MLITEVDKQAKRRHSVEVKSTIIRMHFVQLTQSIHQ